MKYDFDKVIDRRNTNSVKWMGPENELPMWVADMDFSAAPEILEALRARVDHGVFGYSIIPDAWSESIVHWWKKRHDYQMQPEWLMFCTGVVPAVTSIIRSLTSPGDNVLLLTPAYHIFFHCIENGGAKAEECALRYEPFAIPSEEQSLACEDAGERVNDSNTDSESGTYTIDFEQLEQQLADPRTAMMILCNPHNPIGKIWSREELSRIGELCAKHQVIVLSDEIHCDLTDPGRSYIPFASVSGICQSNSVTCIAPTKAFNLAGVQTSAVAVPDPELRRKVQMGLNKDGIAHPSAFAIDAAIAAFTKGEAWLDELRDYLYQNKQEVERFLNEQLPQLHLAPSEATYLLWIDCSSCNMDADALSEHIRKTTGLFLSSGTQFKGNGSRFLRMNIACPRSVLRDGLKRLRAAIDLIL